MSHTGTYVFRGGQAVKISDRTPHLKPVATEARDDASVTGRILAGYQDLERRGKLGRGGPKSFTPAQIKKALKPA